MEKLSKNHAVMLRRRGYDPKNFAFVKDTYTTLYVRNLKTGKILPIMKYN